MRILFMRHPIPMKGSVCMIDLMTINEVAAACRTNPSTLYHWRYQNRGPRAARIGRKVLYQRADVEAWLEELYDGAVPSDANVERLR